MNNVNQEQKNIKAVNGEGITKTWSLDSKTSPVFFVSEGITQKKTIYKKNIETKKNKTWPSSVRITKK